MKIYQLVKNAFVRLSVLMILFLLNFLNSPLNGQFIPKQRNIAQPLPTRQVHLDFHTSGFMENIGSEFDKKQFQEALKLGNVNQINIFAKCHHGYTYYPTKVGNMHPNLKFDLLKAQLEACHEIGVKAPFYFTVGWSANDAEEHPEYCMREKDGKIATINYDLQASPSEIKPQVSWKILSPTMGSPYHLLIMKQVEELCKMYKPDGFWFDIYHIKDVNYSDFFLNELKKQGIDISDRDAVAKAHALSLKEHMRALRQLVASYHPDATVYFNSATHIRDNYSFKERLYDMNTHHELEDLPTVWGGYDKLPLESKFHLQQGVPIVAMSGKFHKDWGEFGGFKDAAAIKYEAAAMIANGASCNFGDHLYPLGKLDMATYKNIGEAYRFVETIEAYGPGGMPSSKLGVWLTLDATADNGTVQILLETHNDFLVANAGNLSSLNTLIIPSKSSLSFSDFIAVNKWVKEGGRLLVFGEGAINSATGKFGIDVGAEYLGESEFDFDYTMLLSDAQGEIPVISSPFLNYKPAIRMKPLDGTVLGFVREPFFNRTYGKYSGHRETPYKPENSVYPSVIQKGNVILFAHPLDKIYYENGAKLHRDVVEYFLDKLNTKPLLHVSNLPSAGRVSVLKQENQKRWVVHLLYTSPISRGGATVVEDFLPVPNVVVEIDVPEKVTKVTVIPGGKAIPFERMGNKIQVKVPTFSMYTGLVLQY